MSTDFVPNEETVAAICEIEEMKKRPELYKGYTDVHQMFEDILAEQPHD